MLIVECILNVHCLLRHHRHPLLPYVILLDRRFVISAPLTAENCPPPGAVNNNRSAAAFSGYSAALFPHSGVVTSSRRCYLYPASLSRRAPIHPLPASWRQPIQSGLQIQLIIYSRRRRVSLWCRSMQFVDSSSTSAKKKETNKKKERRKIRIPKKKDRRKK